ncbi:hypothetical protein [Streptomyces cinnamoneus]|uniref:hypothetical protein n=1 Tax=Streptomyces cinnamoneus TaxID=53446 RepID=UPI0037950F1C
MRGGLVGVTALGVLVGVPPAGAAATRAEGPAAYRVAAGATAVRGAATSSDGPLIRAGTGTYTDSLKPGERKYYTVELDAASSAYVSAVAAPKPGGTMGVRDGIEVSLQAADGTQCGAGHHRSFLSAGGAYPLADYAERVVKPGAPCRSAGAYRFVVERGDAKGGDESAVPLELRYVAEPPRKNETEEPAGPGGWSTRAPSGPPPGDGESVAGGTGFNDAAELRPGAWKDELRPGETRFYRVAVEAGEQLFADAEFGAERGGAVPFVVSGVRVGLSNEARGHVLNKTGGYQGRPATVSLATPPAAYGGGAGGGEAARGMRLAGWYYLQVSVNPKVRQTAVPVTLKIATAAARRSEQEPGAGRAAGGVEPVAATSRGTHRQRLRLIGYAGIGTGTALLLGLGVWTLLARRRQG